MVLFFPQFFLQFLNLEKVLGKIIGALGMWEKAIDKLIFLKKE